ncbi:MAG: thioesterase family protein [Propionibacteriaceae bacterium]|jgi:fluoroacetyl-CoA thioesterase|nr:thioesterase family protein [Propionibacteriaceae bacterium]
MKPTLHQGLSGTAEFTVTEALTVPALARHYPSYAGMPPAFSTPGLVGFVEQACIDLLAPHLDEGEFSVGVDVELTHTTATPVGAHLTADLQVLQVEPKSVLFAVTVSDNESVISIGQHRRAVLNRDRFVQKLSEKADRLG